MPSGGPAFLEYVGKPPLLLVAARWAFLIHLATGWALRNSAWWWGSLTRPADSPYALAFKIRQRVFWAPPLIGWYLNHWLLLSIILFLLLVGITLLLKARQRNFSKP